MSLAASQGAEAHGDIIVGDISGKQINVGRYNTNQTINGNVLQLAGDQVKPHRKAEPAKPKLRLQYPYLKMEK